LNPCALALRDRNNFVDLTGLAKIRWRTKQTAFITSVRLSSCLMEHGLWEIMPNRPAQIGAKRSSPLPMFGGTF
jgi:hypothetical protein